MKSTKALAPIIGAHEGPKGILYSIHYFDMTDRKWHIGYSSYNLDIVRQCLTNEFEIVPVPDGGVYILRDVDIGMVISGFAATSEALKGIENDET